jgi:hypothetical protein
LGKILKNYLIILQQYASQRQSGREFENKAISPNNCPTENTPSILFLVAFLK